MPRQSNSNTLFGKRLRYARLRAALPQDKLGVLIGLDESSSSARISRYETGEHEPPFQTAEKLASALSIPVAFFYCPDDKFADLLLAIGALDEEQRQSVQTFVASLADGN